jgi:HD superfamily phosphohydrolase
VNYYDSIYGPVVIDEPVLVALIESAAIQRLQGVLQHGISGLIGITSPLTRFDHSVGVMLLVRRLGASLEEQAAALLHDVSHTAFSHVIDYVFADHDGQSYHDRVKASYVAQTDIPAILTRFGYDWQLVLNEERFPLLEQPAPRLCADRIDYFLRDSLSLKLATAEEIAAVLQHLLVYENRIVVDDLSAARWLAERYIAADDASWANFREVALYELTAQAIRLALQKGILSEADLWGTDAPVWARLHSAADSELQALLHLISPDTRFVRDEYAPTFSVSTKLRTIDPDVLLGNKLITLTALDTEFARHRVAYLGSKQGKWPIRVLSQ